MTEDGQLLRRYLEERSEHAFAELVTRNIDLVYSAALRIVGGDAHLAQDVTQTVFADLARKGWNLPKEVVLAGWLYRHACFTASKAVRAERRRQTRERTAMDLRSLQNEPEPCWDQIVPILDDAMNRLSTSDRDAVVLRFLRRQDLRAVGAALGVSEHAAQKRVSRALEKLRRFLSGRGVELSAMALSAALSSQATVAPAGLAASVAAEALAGATAGTGVTAMNLIAMTKLKTGVAGALVVAGLTTPLILQYQSLNRLRDENRVLREQTETLARLQEENARLVKSQPGADELERLRNERSELMRLRGEVAGLRDQLRSVASKPQSPAPVNAATGPDATQKETATVETYLANVRAAVPAGQTLVTGGWTTEPGKRTLMFVRPEVIAGDQNTTRVLLKGRILEVPDLVLSGMRLDALKADGKETSMQHVFSEEQAVEVLKALERSEGVKVVSSPTVLTSDGQQAQVSVTQQRLLGGEVHALGPSLDIMPRVSGDRASVDLTMSGMLKRAVQDAH